MLNLRKAKLVIQMETELIVIGAFLECEAIFSLATSNNIRWQLRLALLAGQIGGVLATELEINSVDLGLIGALVLADGEVGNVDVLVHIRVGLGSSGGEGRKGGEGVDELHVG